MMLIDLIPACVSTITLNPALTSSLIEPGVAATRDSLSKVSLGMTTFMIVMLIDCSHKMAGEINTGYADFITELLKLST